MNHNLHATINGFKKIGGKCDRCRRKSKDGILRLMGHTKENSMYICSDCHKLWRDKYIKKLDEMELMWEERSEMWNKMYAEFRGEFQKEKVEFT